MPLPLRYYTSSPWAPNATVKVAQRAHDSGIAFCAHPDSHREAIAVHASYLVHGDEGGPRDQMDWTPEFSRRARGFAIYAAIRSLGRAGIATMVERCCEHARRFAELLSDGGAEVMNEVVLNQVLFRFGDGEQTDAVIDRVVRDGTCFLSGTTFRGARAMRISVSNWQTSNDDVERSVQAILRAAAQRRVSSPATEALLALDGVRTGRGQTPCRNSEHVGR
jgi:glutamate/tyrosine decarboxylase-like PLP-dependent enzyme